MKTSHAIRKAFVLTACVLSALVWIDHSIWAQKKTKSGAQGKAPVLITVPDVKQKPRAQAENILKKVGLQTSTIGVGSHVKSQAPLANTKAAKGSVVKLTLVTPKTKKAGTPKTIIPHASKAAAAPTWIVDSVRAIPGSYQADKPVNIQIGLKNTGKGKSSAKQVTLDLQMKYRDTKGKPHIVTKKLKLKAELKGKKQYTRMLRLQEATKADGKDPLMLVVIAKTGGRETGRKTLRVAPSVLAKITGSGIAKGKQSGWRTTARQGSSGTGDQPVSYGMVSIGELTVNGSSGPGVTIAPNSPLWIGWDYSRTAGSGIIAIEIHATPIDSPLICAQHEGQGVEVQGFWGTVSFNPTIGVGESVNVWGCPRSSTQFVGVTNIIQVQASDDAPPGDLDLGVIELVRRNNRGFVKEVRFGIRYWGPTSTSYSGPLPLEVIHPPHNVRLRCPDDDYTLDELNSAQFNCDVVYPTGAWLMEMWAVAPEVPSSRLEVTLENPNDPNPANNTKQGAWPLWEEDPAWRVNVKDVHVVNNNTSNPTIRFKVKNKSRGPALGGTVMGPAISIDNVWVGAFVEGRSVWSGQVGGDGHLNKHEVVQIYIPGGLLPEGRHEISISAMGNHNKKNYHKKSSNAADAAEFKVKDVTRSRNNTGDVEVRFKVKNIGGSDSNGGYGLFYSIDGQPESFHYETGAPLLAGEKRFHEISDLLPAGDHQLKIHIAAMGGGDDPNTNNNTKTKNYKKNVRYDFKIKDLSRQQNGTSNVKIQFKVKNAGPDRSPSYCLEYTVLEQPSRNIPMDCQNYPLNSGLAHEHTIQENLPGTNDNRHTLQIHVRRILTGPTANFPEESNTNNNTKTKKYKKPGA